MHEFIHDLSNNVKLLGIIEIGSYYAAGFPKSKF